MPEYRTLSLLPNTGVQLIRLPGLFSREELKAYKLDWLVKEAGVASSLVRTDDGEPHAGAQDSGRGAGEQAAPPSKVRGLASEVVELSYSSPMPNWVPVAFNQSRTSCGMIWFDQRSVGDDEEDDQQVYDAVIAFDTTVTERGVGGTLYPELVGSSFMLHDRGDRTFWEQPQVATFLDAIAQESGGARWSAGEAQAHLASFYAMLASKQAAGEIPVILLQSATQAPVEVSLVVDFGNSRTCCVVTEENDQGHQKYQRLELRDLSNPLETVKEPFSSRMAFVAPKTGVYPRLSKKGCEPPLVFEGLSLSKMGPGAENLLSSTERDIGPRSLSAPKRYLWDELTRKAPWQVAEVDPLRGREALYGPLLGRIDARQPFKEPVEDDTSEPPQPAYPRKIGMLWAAVEILEQAYAYVNSPEHRGAESQKALHDRRRVIRHVVAMHPAGMHPTEIASFREALERASQLWAEYRTEPQGFNGAAGVASVTSHDALLEPSGDNARRPTVPVPHVDLTCDEGLAIQICYLNSLIEDHFPTGVRAIADALGSERPDALRALSEEAIHKDSRVIRIASLDVGGGTTDLAIADYLAHHEAPQPKFTMRSLFHDGFNKGGDDIIYRLLVSFVHPQVCEQLGIAPEDWSDAFSSPEPHGLPTDWIELRKQLSAQVWMPLAEQCLKQLGTGAAEFACDLGSVVSRRECLRAAQSILEEAGLTSSKSTRLEKVKIRVSQGDVSSAVRLVLRNCIEQFSDLVAQFRCDLMVVGGRPSSLPSVRALVEASLPVPPGNLVFLHESRFGRGWFPFEHRGDSKTCGVMGAALAFHAKFQRSALVLRTAGSGEGPPCQLGYLNSRMGTLNREKVLFSDGQELSEEIFFESNEMVIGSTRINDPKALAQPVYRLARCARIDELLAKSTVKNEPLRVRLRRASTDTGAFTSEVITEVAEVKGTLSYMYMGEIEQAVDDSTVLELRLQTMDEDDHWIDSGRFEPLTGVGRRQA